MTKSVIWTVIGYGFCAACNLAMGILISHQGPNALGYYGTALRFSDPFVYFAALNLRTLFVTKVLDRHTVSQCIATRIVGFAIAVPVVYFFTGYFVHDAYYTALLTAVFALGNIFDGVADSYFSIYQLKKRYDMLALSQVLRGLLNITMFTLFFFTHHHSLVWGVCGSTLASLIMLTCFDYNVASIIELGKGNGRVKPDFNFKEIIDIARIASPLALSLVMDSITLAFPMMMVASIFNPGMNIELTRYGYLVNVGFLLVTGLTMTLGPKMSDHWKHGQKRRFLKLNVIGNGILLGVALLLLIVANFAGNALIHDVLSKTATVDLALFSWVIINGAIKYVVTMNGIALTTMRYVSGQLLYNLPSFFFVVLTSRWFVSNYQLYGAVWATFIGSVMKLAIGAVIFFVLYRKKNTPINQYALTDLSIREQAVPIEYQIETAV